MTDKKPRNPVKRLLEVAEAVDKWMDEISTLPNGTFYRNQLKQAIAECKAWMEKHA